jgi:peroxiredoxin
MSFKKLFLASLLLILIIFSACVKKTDIENPGSPYDFSLPDLKGKIHTLKEFQGKIILLNFWATWCPSCKEDITSLIAIYNQYKDSGLEIVGISLDKKELGVVDSFVQEMKIPYTILLGDEVVVKNYGGFKGIPTTFLLDRNGRIVKKYSGQITEEALKSDLKIWLRK